MKKSNKLSPPSHKPFPLKRYFIVYAGIGGLIFYAMLLSFFIHAERQALHQQYIAHLVEKAGYFYRDIDREILQKNNITFQKMPFDSNAFQKIFRNKIEKLLKSDFSFVKTKLFNRDGIVLYDHKTASNEGKPYNAIQGEGFQSALKGISFSKLEEEDQSRFMEVYIPVYDLKNHTIVGIMETYEDVSRFEEKVLTALQQALVLPTLIFIAFNLLFFVIITKADRIISQNTNLLLRVRRKMEKYISPSATQAIYNAITQETELFQGEMQTIVSFFSDVRGFTSYSEHESPEVVVKNLNHLFELQAEHIHAHHGVIDKFIGDEIMAIFPEDNLEGAVLASLEIVKGIHNNTDVAFEVGIGVHTGEALVGSIGTTERHDYTAIGNTINTAARFCSIALAGQVIISDTIFHQLSHEVQQQFMANEKLALKGKTEQMMTYISHPLSK
ncbi:MAG: adenylate/guanylate cyclase domain-containing protein [Mariprofundaceae bacterium]